MLLHTPDDLLQFISPANSAHLQLQPKPRCCSDVLHVKCSVFAALPGMVDFNHTENSTRSGWKIPLPRCSYLVRCCSAATGLLKTIPLPLMFLSSVSGLILPRQQVFLMSVCLNPTACHQCGERALPLCFPLVVAKGSIGWNTPKIEIS